MSLLIRVAKDKVPGLSEESGICVLCYHKIIETQDSIAAPYAFISNVYGHQATLTNLQDSARSGCYICSILWSRNQDRWQTIFHDGLETELIINWHSSQDNEFTIRYSIKESASLVDIDSDDYDPLSSIVDFEGKNSSTSARSEAFSLIECQESPFSAGESQSTDSAETWSTIRQWMSVCRTEHDVCNAYSSSERWYPTRLLLVGSNDGDTVRLVETTNANIEGNYCSLSHCWGGMEFLQLTDNTFPILKNRVPLDELPQTFRDAIQVTRELGIQYLWVDSLCIIQNQVSKEDWLREAPMMGRVYSSAFCNIGATGAINGTVGLLHPRNPNSVFPSAIEQTPKRHVLHQEEWEIHILRSPLLSRGWVVQERVLAPRMLHFGLQEVMWECCQLQASERFPAGHPTERELFQHTALFKSQYTPLWAPDASPEILHSFWSNVIANYSRTSLTFADDKLVAVAGLAKQIYRHWKIDYIAGLWNVFLPDQLFWRLDEQELLRNPRPCKRPVKYRAPSFSWASIDAPVYWPEMLLSKDSHSARKLIHVVHIEASPLGTDPMTQIKDGKMVICGPLKMLNPEKRHRASSTPLGILSYDTAELKEDDSNLHVLPLMEYSQNLTGLVLKLLNDQSGRFRRVGSIEIGTADDPFVPVKYREKILNNRQWLRDPDIPDLVPCSCKESCGMSGMYTITII